MGLTRAWSTEPKLTSSIFKILIESSLAIKKKIPRKVLPEGGIEPPQGYAPSDFESKTSDLENPVKPLLLGFLPDFFKKIK
jgi:hypothetical protein